MWSPKFWEHVVVVIVVLEPVYSFIRFSDGPKPDVGEVYHNFRDVGIKIYYNLETQMQKVCTDIVFVGSMGLQRL